MPTIEELKRAAGADTIDIEARILGYAVISAEAHSAIPASYSVDVRVGPVIYRVVAYQGNPSVLVFQVKKPRREAP